MRSGSNITLKDDYNNICGHSVETEIHINWPAYMVQLVFILHLIRLVKHICGSDPCLKILLYYEGLNSLRQSIGMSAAQVMCLVCGFDH